MTAARRPLVSVVIPVYHDTSELAALLSLLADETASRAIEVIVVNGAGADPSLAPVRGAYPAVRWVESPRGRGRQMNAGAAVAEGRWILFLHADARPDDRWRSAIEAADREAGVVGGAFRLAIRSAHPAARVIERGVALRVRWCRLPYGDQAVFVRRAVFDALGGYAPLPLMEDVDFVRRLARRGRLRFPPVPVRVSARRWERDGWTRRSVSNVGLLALYGLGVDPRRLAAWYEGGPAPGIDND